MLNVCRFCSKELRLGDLNIEIMYCQAFNGNSSRFDTFQQICQYFAFEIVDNFLDRICNTCDESLLSTVLFVEKCLEANEFFKTEVKTDIDKKYDTSITVEPEVMVPQVSLNFEPETSNIETNVANECELCCRKFRNINTYEKHMRNLHEIEKAYEIPDYKELLADTEHFYCDYCEGVFEKKQLLRKHIKEHLKNFICHCGKSYKRPSSLKNHQLQTHLKQTVQCSECGKVFKSPYSLKHHFNIHRKIKPFQCETCLESFYYPTSLAQHKNRVHCIVKKEYGNKKQRFLCDNCGDSFSRQYHLDRHRLHRHTEDAPLAFPCETCGKAFVDRDRLRAHMRIHTNELNFQCTDCGKGFRSQSARQSHMNRVHLDLRPFPCATCDRAFKSKSNLEKHIRTHTGEKPYACPLCSYFCAELSNLKKHLKIHNRSAVQNFSDFHGKILGVDEKLTGP